jgi:hypothetical protein
MHSGCLNIAGMLWGAIEWLRFSCGMGAVRSAQLSVLRALMRESADTEWGRAHDFHSITSYEQFRKLPVTEYDDYETFVQRIKAGEQNLTSRGSTSQLLPTSGTTRGSKLIPFTPGLRAEFNRALKVWLVNSFLRSWRAAAGKQYWSLSPVTRFPDPRPGAVPIGFADDGDYFGTFQKRLLANGFVLPQELNEIEDGGTHDYLTLLFLLKERNLSFIFVWSPTFLIAKLEKIQPFEQALLNDIRGGTIAGFCSMAPRVRAKLERICRPDPKRYDELSKIRFADRSQWRLTWPRLRLISCWSDAASGEFYRELKDLFPAVRFEEKGLVATEAVVTIPWRRGNMRPVAYRSHFFEFKEAETGRVLPLWEIVPGHAYTVIVSTGGGLYRYALHDVVEVTGYIGSLPCLKFLGRGNAVVDVAGEKIQETMVREFFENQKTPPFDFAFVAPTKVDNRLAYTLFVERRDGCELDSAALCGAFDACFNENYHYRHARRTGQLDVPRVFIVERGTGLASFLSREEHGGKRAGDIKFRYLDGGLYWPSVFNGAFAS